MGKTNAQLVWDFNKTFQRKQLEPLHELTEESEQLKMMSQLKLIHEEVDELGDAIKEGDWEEIKDAIIDILVVTYGMGYLVSIDCDKGMEEVNRANMSKLCTSQDEVVATTEYYNKLGVECSVQNVGENLWAIKSAKYQTDINNKTYPEGKFLKNINWEVPNLDFIEK